MNVLEKIVLDKRDELVGRKNTMPLFAFKDGLEPSTRNFYSAIKQDKTKNNRGFILEVKKASPSKGLIREDFNLEEICSAYKNYASSVSVLTDEKYFQGDFERLPKVRELMQQPILCKDFFVDEYQVYLARLYGADAILLMLSVLNDEEYRCLADVAHSLEMDILTEVSNAEEMDRAINLNANIVGINNRNLRDLSTDLNQTIVLTEQFLLGTDKERQANTLLISESGIYTHQQVAQLSTLVDGFLVGSSLMAEKDLDKACSKLTCGEHKICGLTTSEHVIDAVQAGAEFTGLIFAEQSKRKLELSKAKQIVDEVSASNNAIKTKYVAVVQNQSIEFVRGLINELPLFAVQLHGNESEDYIKQVRALGTNCEIWKACSIGASEDLPVHWPNVDRIVLDAKSINGELGGTGQTFEWSKLAPLFSKFDGPKIMLAGGISISNLDSALSQPVIGLDLNSGVESSPGVKSIEKLNNIFNKIMSRTASLKDQHESE